MGKVTQLGTGHIKPATIPDVLKRMETADATIVIHLHGGKWTLQHMKGNTSIWKLMGILQCIIVNFAELANGK